MAWSKHSFKVATVLSALFGVMLLLLLAASAIPMMDAFGKLRAAEHGASLAKAEQEVFAALQNVRLERGTLQTALKAPGPAEASFVADVAALRTKSAPALAAVLRHCAALDCADRDSTVSELRTSLEKLEAARRAADQGIRRPAGERPAGLYDQWTVAVTDMVDRLEKLSAALVEKLRLVDPAIAELMEIEQVSYLARDSAGLERNLIRDAIAAKGLTVALQKAIADRQARVDSAWSLVRELTKRPGVPADVVAAVKKVEAHYFGEFLTLRASIYAALEAGQVPAVSGSELIKITNPVLDSLGAVPNAAVVAAERNASERADVAFRDVIRQIGFVIMALALGALCFLMVRRRVVRPLTVVATATRRLAAGAQDVDLAAISSRGDEIGAMAQALEFFKANMAEADRLRVTQEAQKAESEEERRAAMLMLAEQFEQSVGGIVHSVASAAGQMRGAAQGMSATAEEASRQALAVSAAASQASGNVQTVAAATDELSASIGEIGQQVGRSAAIAREAAQQAERTNGAVEGLSRAAQKIGAIIHLIQEIAGQTNLLALNATIEAARAGEAGRGFAVVASEVKSLAGQTAKATEDISAQISAIQSTTGEVVGAIREIGATIGEINQIATMIASAVEQQGAATREIAGSVNQAAHGTQEVSTHISGVTRASSEVGAVAGEVLGAAGELSRQSERLGQEVERFLSTVRAA